MPAISACSPSTVSTRLTSVSTSCSESINRRSCALAAGEISVLSAFVVMSGGKAPIRPPVAASSPAMRSRFTPLTRPAARMAWMPIATGVPLATCEADFHPFTAASILRSSRPFAVGVRLVSAR